LSGKRIKANLGSVLASKNYLETRDPDMSTDEIGGYEIQDSGQPASIPTEKSVDCANRDYSKSRSFS
jgi:hypothetical protein